ncbi:hypothetical protein ES703_102278 [subsurface metagenome]
MKGRKIVSIEVGFIELGKGDFQVTVPIFSREEVFCVPATT